MICVHVEAAKSIKIAVESSIKQEKGEIEKY